MEVRLNQSSTPQLKTDGGQHLTARQRRRLRRGRKLNHAAISKRYDTTCVPCSARFGAIGAGQIAAMLAHRDAKGGGDDA